MEKIDNIKNRPIKNIKSFKNMEKIFNIKKER